MNQMTRNIPRWILAFIGSLLLFAAGALLCVRLTLFNQNFMIQQMHQAKYIETIRKDVTESIQDVGRGSNIPPEVLSDVVTEELVTINVENYIRGIYQNIPFQLQGEDQIKENILKNVEQYAQEKKIPIDETTEKNLTNLAETAAKNFSAYIEIPYLMSYGQKVMAFESSLNVIMFVVGAAFLLIFAGLQLMIKMTHQRVRWSSITFFGAGLMLATLPTIIYFSGVIQRLGITSEGLYRFVTSYVTTFDLSFVFVGLAVIGVAIILVIISERMRDKRLFTIH
jgi:hypothetical protein